VPGEPTSENGDVYPLTPTDHVSTSSVTAGEVTNGHFAPAAASCPGLNFRWVEGTQPPEVSRVTRTEHPPEPVCGNDARCQYLHVGSLQGGLAGE
jgi:hypothetical protein